MQPQIKKESNSSPFWRKGVRLNEKEAEVFPPDTRVNITNTRTVPYQWICKIRVRYEDPKTGSGGWSDGSGVLISPTIVLTCAHVLLGLGKPAGHTRLAKIEVTPGANSGASPPFGLYESTTFMVHPNYGKGVARNGLDHSFVNFPFDYGIIKLKKPVSFPNIHTYWGKYATGSLVRLDEKCILNQTVKVAGYPPQSSQVKEGEGPARKIVAQNVDKFISDRVFIHLADTEASQSGGPIWMECKIGPCIIPCLIGIHVGGNRTMQMNFGLRITLEVLKNIASMTKALRNK